MTVHYEAESGRWYSETKYEWGLARSFFATKDEACLYEQQDADCGCGG